MITKLDFYEFTKGIDVNQVRGQRGVIGPTWNDLMVILRLVEKKNPRRCLEVGLHYGHTARLLLRYSPGIRCYIGIDREPNKKDKPMFHPGHVVDEELVQVLLHPKGTRGIANDTVPGAPFDFIFIDADHRYEGVKFDTQWALPLLAQNGLIFWHDYNVPSQYRPGGKVFGVARFINEFGRENSVKVFEDPAHTSSIAFSWEEGLKR